MKEVIKRVLRTFVQAAAGFVAANCIGYLSGMEGTAGDNALLALITAAVASGICAVMNVPRRTAEKDDISEDAAQNNAVSGCECRCSCESSCKCSDGTSEGDEASDGENGEMLNCENDEMLNCENGESEEEQNG